jgi:hypothetical protein
MSRVAVFRQSGPFLSSNRHPSARYHQRSNPLGLSCKYNIVTVMVEMMPARR